MNNPEILRSVKKYFDEKGIDADEYLDEYVEIIIFAIEDIDPDLIETAKKHAGLQNINEVIRLALKVYCKNSEKNIKELFKLSREYHKKSNK